MAPTPTRRVSYVIPPPNQPVPKLKLPPLGVPRNGAIGPLLSPAPLDDEPPPERAPHPRHRLAVASLALDTCTQLAGSATPEGILYTGGRDGLIISWELGLPMTKRAQKYGAPEGGRRVGRWENITGWGDNVIDEEGEEGDDGLSRDGDILGEVKQLHGRRRSGASSTPDGSIPYEEQWQLDSDALNSVKPTQFRQSVQAHTDWVNDIVLCNYNQTVVSASSDGTVKAWNPHSTSSLHPSTVGIHTDYVRCLAHSREQKWIASGSFDRTIKLWDLSRALSSKRQEPLMSLHPPEASGPKSSVYAIAADPFGHLIASGSPERVVRTWDPRTGKRTGKLVGHTDNIRAILISEDSRYLLTGSADASIKLWSTASPQRCLHTFTYHTDSVWSLFSSHPSLEIFYSGDRSGIVCKVDVEGCGDVAEGECVVLCQDIGAGGPEGINSMTAMDDAYVWTAAGGSSAKRWRVPQQRVVRAANPDIDGEVASPSSSYNAHRSNTLGIDTTRLSPRSASLPIDNDRSPSRAAHRASLVPSIAGSIASESMYSQADADEMRVGAGTSRTICGIPVESLVRLADPYTTFSSVGRARDPEVSTLYSAASIVSVPRNVLAASRSPLRGSSALTRSDTLSKNNQDDSVTLYTTNGVGAGPQERDVVTEAVPLSEQPDDVIVGDHGLVRSVILNDRMHALSVDTTGEVAVWDIVRGVCVGRFSREDVAAASHCGSAVGDGESGNAREMERSPREALETVRERIEGEAVVQPWAMADTKIGDLTVHLLDKCFEAEIFADEAGYGAERRFNDEFRLNLGKWVLRNLFLGFIREEQRAVPQRLHDGHHSPALRGVQRSSAPTHISLDEHSPANRARSSSNASTTISLHSGRTPMTPTVPPDIQHSKLVGSPLLTPMPMPIAQHLQTVKEGQLSPMPPLGSNDATPTHIHRAASTDSSLIPSTPQPNKDADYFSMRMHRLSTSHTASASSGDDDFSAWGGPGSKASSQDPTAAQTPSTPSAGGIMGRLKSLGKGSAKRPLSENGTNTGLTTPGADLSTSDAKDGTSPAVNVPKTPLEELLSNPLTPPSASEAPPLSLPANMTLVISEEVPSGWTTIYRGTVASVGPDVHILEEKMPLWLLEYLLLNKTPPLVVTKVSFVLLPVPGKGPGVRDESEQLPELLNSAQSKLSASRFLRVRKLTNHVHERLEKMAAASRPSSRPTSRRSSSDMSYGSPHSRSLAHDTGSVVSTKPEDNYEILCNDVVLPLDMTLAAVRQYIWRQNGELIMYYRRKISSPPNSANDLSGARPIRGFTAVS